MLECGLEEERLTLATDDYMDTDEDPIAAFSMYRRRSWGVFTDTWLRFDTRNRLGTSVDQEEHLLRVSRVFLRLETIGLPRIAFPIVVLDVQSTRVDKQALTPMQGCERGDSRESA